MDKRANKRHVAGLAVQRRDESIARMAAAGVPRDRIARQVGLSSGRVSTIAAREKRKAAKQWRAIGPVWGTDEQRRQLARWFNLVGNPFDAL